MSAGAPLLAALAEAGEREAVRFGERALRYEELARCAAGVAARVAGAPRVAVWATPTLETCVAVAGALVAGVECVPVNPRSGARELAYIVADSAPAAVLAGPAEPLPEPLAGLVRVAVDANPGHACAPLPAEPDAGRIALIVYTSGTTGPPKGACLTRRALAANLDALAAAWAWSRDDVLVHALPLFHVHGLVLGLLGPLRHGSSLHHVGSFSVEAVAAELAGPASVLFGVPTMYHRLAERAEREPFVARALGRARLLVSGSAGLPRPDHERIRRACGKRVLERYGMTETLITCAVPARSSHGAGSVGPPLAGVELRLVDDEGGAVCAGSEGIGEIEVRSPGLFRGYLNRPQATADAFSADGWFRTGDLATRDDEGYVSIVGRRATDLIKCGGYKVGAGEVESVLLEHPGVAEAAVTGEPDEDLGERIVAWVVAAPGRAPSADELADHVARLLAPHKRPRSVRFVEALPRNEMGKVLKSALR